MLVRLAIRGLLAFSAITAVEIPPPLHPPPRHSHPSTGVDSMFRAELSIIDSTSISLTILNRGPRDMSLVKANTLLDPSTQAQSFSIRTFDGKTLQARPTIAAHADGDVTPDQIPTLPAQSGWTGTYKLTELFEVPKADKYNVSFATTLFATKTPLDGEIPHSYMVSAPARMMFLAKSSLQLANRDAVSPVKVKRDLIQHCDAGQTWVIRNVLPSTIQMAAAAASYVPTTGTNPLYTKYFNNNDQQTVREVFKYIASYQIDIINGFTWYCDIDPGSKTYCQEYPSAYGYAPWIGSKLRYLTLCPFFFTKLWASTICHVPGANDRGPPGWQIDLDQPSIMMHEMLHDAKLAGLGGIDDGQNDTAQGQYTYKQVTNLAINSASNGDAPIKNSQSFVYFALEVRNLTSTPQNQECIHCPLQPPSDICAQAPSSPACQSCSRT